MRARRRAALRSAKSNVRNYDDGLAIMAVIVALALATLSQFDLSSHSDRYLIPLLVVDCLAALIFGYRGFRARHDQA